MTRGTRPPASERVPGILANRICAPRAKRIIYLFMQGGPSQLDLFDYKPDLANRHGEELPESVRMGQRITGMTAKQSSLPVAPSPFKFAQHGKSGAWVSELLPRIARIADDLCFIRSVNSEAINHDPAITFLQTGHQLPGRPSLAVGRATGWGPRTSDLPAFVVLISRGSAPSRRPIRSYARLWGSAFLPSSHQGVSFRSSGDPVLYLSNPDGMTGDDRRRMLTTLGKLNEQQHAETLDPEIEHSHRAIRDGLSDADVGPGADRFEPGIRQRPSKRYGDRGSPAGHVRRELPAGAAAGRARLPLHPALSSRLGPALQPADESAAAVPRRRSAVCGAGDAI